MKKNEGMHTPESVLVQNILNIMKDTDYRSGLRKSALGYAAYPNYKFSWPQGAAFSVAKICRKLESSGLIRCNSSNGCYITNKGKELLRS